MKITKELALRMLQEGYEVVVDSQYKPVHTVTDAGEHTVHYKKGFFLENSRNRREQHRITAGLAKQLAGECIREAYTWSSHA